MKDDQEYKYITLNDITIPSTYAASSFVEFLRYLHQHAFGLDAHSDFGDYIRVTTSF